MTIMSSSEALMELLRNEGVDYVFGIPGLTETFFMDALENHPEIKYILGLHEVVPSGMAEGYARTSGKVGVVNFHTLTGLSAAMPMLHNAYQAGAPILITAGQQDNRLIMQEPHLNGDLVRMASQFTKWSTEVTYAADIPRAIQRAFKEATHPPTGPVFVSLPMNVLNENIDFELAPNTPPFNQLRPDETAINRAIELLKVTQNPVVIVESGIARNDALPEVVKFAELIGAKVYQHWMADVNFPVQHPQYLGDLDTMSPRGREILSSVDVLILIGAPPFSPVVYLTEPLLNNKTKVIQIDDNPHEIGKNFPVASGIQGNIKTVLAELNGILDKSMSKSAHQEAKIRAENTAREKEAMEKAFLEKVQQERDNIPTSGSRLMSELRDILKPDTLIVDDCWSYSAALRRILKFSDTKSFQRARCGGSIGWGMPGALGVKLAAPDRPVVSVCGDGSAAWSIQSLWTAARYNIPVKYIVCANKNYATVKFTKLLLMGEKGKGRYLGADIDEPRLDFCQLAQSMGVNSQRVERPDELRDILKSMVESDKPELVEVSMEKTS